MTRYRIKGTSGSVINQSFPLGARLVIGSDRECDVRLQGETVAGRHAELVTEGSGPVTIRSLDSGAEVLLNGEPVTERNLAGGDEIRIGTCRFILQAPGLRPERVLTEATTKPGRNLLPWLLALAGIAAAVLAYEALRQRTSS